MIVLVTGTDTEVGKTFVAAALARLLVARGGSVLAIKPVESGCPEPPSGSEDGAILARATGQEAPRVPAGDERHRGHRRRSRKRFLKLAVASLLTHENIPGLILPEQELEHGEQVRFAGAEVSLQEKPLAFVAGHGVEERGQDEIAVGGEDEILDDLRGEPLVGQIGELDDGADRG